MSDGSVSLRWMAMALLVCASACSGAATVAPQPGLTMTSSRSSYAAGDVLVFTIRNTGGVPLQDACLGMELQQRQPDGSWRDQAGRSCGLFGRMPWNVVVAPGETLTDSFPAAVALPRGTYRALYDFSRSDGTALPERLRASNSFRLE